MKKTTLTIIIVAVAIIMAFYVVVKNGQEKNLTKNLDTNNSENITEPSSKINPEENSSIPVVNSTSSQKKESSDQPKTNEAEVKIFTIDADNYTFSLKEIKIKNGDRVKIVFNNKVGFHDWVIDEFSAKTKQLKAGESETIEFTANKTGTFEYYCSVGQHRQMGMKGNLIVE